MLAEPNGDMGMGEEMEGVELGAGGGVEIASGRDGD